MTRVHSPRPSLAPTRWLSIGVGLAAVLLLAESLLDPWTSYGQEQPPTVAPGDLHAGGMTERLLHVPVTNLLPGDAPDRPPITNPTSGDPQSASRGQKYFSQFNCIGCHAPNGAGGMGPALSNHKFTYGSAPENIYLSILQGRPRGMPAWAGMLPDNVIWDLVSYVQGISQAPVKQWGDTTSASDFTIEQVPAESMQVTDPWDYVKKFSNGQAPTKAPQP